MIDRKSPQQIEIMHQGGLLLGSILAELLDFAQEGVTLLEIDNLAFKRIAEAKGEPSFPTVEGYKWATCLCVNDVVVHGIPTKYALKDSDLLTIDVGMLYKGFHTDTAWTKIIGRHSDPQTETFLKAGEEAMWNGIQEAKIGNRIGHISKAIEMRLKVDGYTVVPTLIGHGVGRSLHEDPQVPGFLRGSVEKTPELIGGETLAVEVIYTEGKGSVVYANDDGWTLATKDHSRASVFEMSIAVTEEGPLVLTRMEK